MSNCRLMWSNESQRIRCVLIRTTLGNSSGEIAQLSSRATATICYVSKVATNCAKRRDWSLSARETAASYYTKAAFCWVACSISLSERAMSCTVSFWATATQEIDWMASVTS